MSAADETDIPALLADLARKRTGSWVTGVGLVTRSSGTIEGVLESLEDNVAVLSTPTGERRIRIAEIENVLLHLTSPGPE
jgi:hypothetical protein